MTVQPDIDVEVLKCEIKKTYAQVSAEQETEFIFPTGRAWALDLGYPTELLDRVPEASAGSFAGVANPLSLGPLQPGEQVLDLGSGAGTDSLVAAQMIGPTGRVVGIDMTPGNGLHRASQRPSDGRHERLVDTYARSSFEDTRCKAAKFGAYGTTVKAYKPPN